MNNSEQHYRVLNLEPTATPEQIYQAYRDLARVWDPQRFAHSPRLELMAEAKLKEIIEAYHALQPDGSGGSAESDSVSTETAAPPPPRDEPVQPPVPADPFAVPGPRLVADLHRPVELPSIPAPAPRPPAVLPVEPLVGLPRPVEPFRTADPARETEQGWQPATPEPHSPTPYLAAANPAEFRARPPRPRQARRRPQHRHRRAPARSHSLSPLSPLFCSWGQACFFARFFCRVRRPNTLLCLPLHCPLRFRPLNPQSPPTRVRRWSTRVT